ncbi:unnamed protein product [Clonostachys rosea]|uniref:Uncharacterized protein n=1 Tax=Bionectria ochroleuca TaxID=29856 RepID=A0ABY6UYM3_BIOOC|nr:unnamed protein product [Clonostachys rosea]
MRSNTIWVGLVAFLASVTPSQADETSRIFSTASTAAIVAPSETSKWLTPVTLVQGTTQMYKRNESNDSYSGSDDDDDSCFSGAGIKGQNMSVGAGAMALVLGTYMAIAF